MPALCPYCQTPLQDGEALVACPACNATHHPDCYRENGGCAIPGCTGRPTRAPRAPQATQPISPRTDEPVRLVFDDHSLPRATPVSEPAPQGGGRTRLSDTEKILIIATLVLAIVVIIILVLLLA